MKTHSRLALTGLGAIALLVSGCTVTTHYRNALHTSYGQAEFDRDNYQCQRENQHQVVFAMHGMAESNNVVDDRMAAACLAAGGWREVEQQQQPPPRNKSDAVQSVASPSLDIDARFYASSACIAAGIKPDDTGYYRCFQSHLSR